MCATPRVYKGEGGMNFIAAESKRTIVRVRASAEESFAAYIVLRGSFSAIITF